MPRPPILWTYIHSFIGTTFHHISNRQFGISTSHRAGVNGSRIFTATYSAQSVICTYAAHNNRSDDCCRSGLPAADGASMRARHLPSKLVRTRGATRDRIKGGPPATRELR